MKKKINPESSEACSVVILKHLKLAFPQNKVLKRVPLKSAEIGFENSSKGCSKAFTGNPILILKVA